MSENFTECDVLDKKTTQYIEKQISQKFIDTFTELSDAKVPIPVILRGLSLAFTMSIFKCTDVRNSSDETTEIFDDVTQVLEKSQKKGVNFPSQAAALALHIPIILGIDYGNLE